MAFYRKRYAKPKYNGKRKFYRKKKLFKKRVQRVINQNAEKKFTQLNHVSGDANNSVGYVVPLYSVANGTSRNERVGDYVQPTGITFTCQYVGVSNTNFCDRFCIMFIRDNETISGAAPLLSDILETTVNALAPDSLLNDNTLGRFKVIKRIVTTVGDQGTDNNFKCLKGRVRLPWSKQHIIRYSGTGGNTFYKNQIYMVICASPDVGDNAVSFNCMTRSWFTDV